uniref:Farnesyl pyrophosphate synthase n=1 Tax=Phyllotreta armoraciae TaxID=1553667 RepID=A0A140AZ59_9CUCU|nr:isopentenyl diphosphate synthase [Phyllotreta armoraciae]
MHSTYCRNLLRPVVLKNAKCCEKVRFRSSLPRSNATYPTLASFSEADTEEFMSHFPTIVSDLSTSMNLENMKQATDRFALCMRNNVPNGKKVRGLTTVITYKLLEKPENLTPDNIRLANILGWFIELIEAAVVIFDDLMDNSSTRRGGLCWHRQKDVGVLAIADGLNLNSGAYLLLEKYFGNHPHFADMSCFSQRVMYNTAIGQVIDSMRHAPETISLDKFKAIAKYKTGYYTFYFSVGLGMYLSRQFNKDVLENQIAPLLFDMGEYFQIKNDINDCFVKEDVAGKTGTDIEESKCTWLAVKALEKGNEAQKALFRENYGKSDAKSVESIRNLYRELKLQEEFDEYEADFFKSLRKRSLSIESPYSNVAMVLIEKLQHQVYKTVV